MGLRHRLTSHQEKEFEMRRLQAVLSLIACLVSAADVKPAPPPVIWVYAPNWCTVCHEMKKEIGEGDNRLLVKWVEGDESTFPQYIRDHAKQTDCWPVLHHTSPKGQGVLNIKRRTLDYLVELVKCEPFDPPPVVPVKTRPKKQAWIPPYVRRIVPVFLTAD
jgi:hypothetical protein